MKLLMTMTHQSNFPSLSEEWDTPYTISNLIIDIDSTLVLKILFQNSLQIRVDVCQIRIFQNLDLDMIGDLCSWVINQEFNSVEIILPYSNVTDLIISNFIEIGNVTLLTLFNSPYDKLKHLDDTDGGLILYVQQDVKSNKSCGLVDVSFFTSNMSLFTESLHHNSCLNRKISIDVNGDIKNCPSMSESFGNIKDTTLAEAIEKPGFKKYWNINKDKIHVCKDCEFRYICTDCRAYVEDPEDIFSKPLKCGYNPYTGEWSEWSTNPLKQKAIDFYGMREMVDEMEGPKA